MIAAPESSTSSYVNVPATADLLDTFHPTAFQRKVLLATAAIPEGSTSTYAELAAMVGSPRAVRAVGNALAQNPLPFLIPCHRVLRSDGGLGGYRFGVALKRSVLQSEGVAVH
jgi:AraC family transcriptional regulator of adaptative response/methylated-DNA-[protein]-cysteine methyltransferase